MTTKTVYIVRNNETGFTLFNKVTGLWNDNSKPHLNGKKAWTFAVKKSGLNSPAIQDAKVHLAKLGYNNISFELAEIDPVTKELVSTQEPQVMLALPEYIGEPMLPAPYIIPMATEAPVEPEAPKKKSSKKSTSKKSGSTKKASKKTEKIAA